MPIHSRAAIRSSGPDAIRSACSIADVAFAIANRRWASPVTPRSASNARRRRSSTSCVASPSSRAPRYASRQWYASSSTNSFARVPRRLLDPRRDRRVRARPLAPREALVGDVAREDVLEDELRLPGRSTTRAATAPGPAPRVGRASDRSRSPSPFSSRPTGPGQNTRPDHRRALERALLHGVQQVDPGGEHALHRVRDLRPPRSSDARASGRPRARSRPRRSAAGRSPRGRTGCPRRARGSARAPAGQSSTVSSSPHQPLRSCAVSGSSAIDGDVALAAAPSRAALGQLGPGGAQEEHRPDRRSASSSSRSSSAGPPSGCPR